MIALTAAALARIVGGIVEGDDQTLLSGADVDSRLVRSGELFVAVPGEHLDGHDFVDQALNTAAAALVLRTAELGPPPAGKALIRVDDPLTAYHRLAGHQRLRNIDRVIAVTGSLGKTTTKDFLAHLLRSHFQTGVSQGNRNSTLGLPSELLRQPAGLQVFVAEAGMSRAGELDALGRILEPDLLLYTRLAPAHTEFFAGMDEVVAAKAELLRHLRRQGTLVVNAGDPYQAPFAAASSAEVITYGGSDSQARLLGLEDRGLLGTCFRLVIRDQQAFVEFALPGTHQAENLLAAAAAAAALGISVEAIAAAAAGLRAAPHRGRLLHLPGRIALLDDSYNSSPVAVARLLELLAVVGGRRIAVLGEMYELGSLTAGAHSEAGVKAAAACDRLLAVGSEPARVLAAAARQAGMSAATVHHAEDVYTATKVLQDLLATGDTVLVKGSRGVGLDRMVAAMSAEGVN